MTEGAPALEATPRNLRDFGAALGCVLAVFAALSWRRGGSAWPWLLGAGGASALAALACPWLLGRPFRLWMRLAGFMAEVNTTLLMGGMFYAVFTPCAVAARLLGKDLLDERLRTGESYWKDREPDEEPSAHERQF